MSTPKQTVLVGIALASRTASVSFLLPGKNGQPTPVSGWPEAEDVKSLVVPIRVKSYLPSSVEPTSANIDWGYSVKPGGEEIQDNILWRVGEDLGSPTEVQILQALRKREGARKYGAGQFAPAQLMSIFVDATKSHIEKRIGLAFGQEILRNVEYDVCVTVPSWWNSAQRELYLGTLKKAYATTSLACGATASLAYYLSKTKKHPLKPEDTYVHCDMEQEITTIGPSTVLTITPALMLSPGNSKIITLGTVDIANSFHDFVEKRLLDFLNGSQDDPKGVIEEFEKLKLNFLKFLPRLDGSRSYKFRLPWNVADSVSSGIVDSQMTISNSDLASSVFDPLLKNLTDTFTKLQLTYTGNIHILLSGALSECPYVSKYIETFAAANTNITLLKSINGGTASSRGAAVHLDASQKSRMAALTPCQSAEVLPIDYSRLLTLEAALENLEKATYVEVEPRIVQLKRILQERILRSGYDVDVLKIFASLGDLYGKAGKSAERLALRLEFEALFMPAEHAFTSTSRNPESATNGVDFHDYAEIRPGMPGLEAIHFAALTDTPSALSYLVDSGCLVDQPVTQQTTDYTNWTALHFAVFKGNLPVIGWLLENGSDASKTTAELQTALHVAISESNRLESAKVHNVVELLLPSLFQKPAMNLEDDSGLTALDYAKSRNLHRAVELLIQYGATENPRIEQLKLDAVGAAKSGNAILLQKLLRQTPGLVRHITPNQENLLHFAAESGNSQSVLQLLNAGVDVNNRNLRDETPLHLAAAAGHDSIVKLLAQKKGNLALQNGSGNDVLQIATEVGNVSMVSTLLQLGAKPNVTNRRGWTSLHIAAEKEAEPLIKLLIDRGGNVNSQSVKSSVFKSDQSNGTVSRKRANQADTDGGWRPLHIAAFNGNEQLVKMLLKSGAEVNALDALQYTPFHRAVQNGHEKILNLLMKNKADPGTSTTSSKTALHDAALIGSEPIVKLLLKSSTKTKFTQDDVGRTALHEAVDGGREDIVKMLLKKGFPPNLKTIGEGFTALSLAVLSGSPGIVKLLLKNGADANVVHDDKSTLIHLAARSKAAQPMIDTFYPKTNIMPRDENGAAPLHIAVEAGNIAAVNAFLRRKVDINALDKRSRTPLFISVERGNLAISSLLADNGAGLEIRDSKRSTPLHTAAALSNSQHIEFLSRRRVAMDPFDSSGRTPLHYAIDNNDQAIGRLLLDFGARAGAFNPPRLPAIFSAVEKGNESVVRMLLARPNSGVDAVQTTGSLEGHHGDTKYTIDQEGWTPLHVAAWHGHAAIALILLQHGANVNAKAKGSDMTPLHLTTFAFQRHDGHLQISRTLLDFGADPHIISEGKTIIHMAALTGNGPLLALLIEKGIPLSKIDSDGRTAMSHAVHKNQYDTCVLLLNSGVDVNEVTASKESYLHVAASANSPDICKLMISKGLDVNAVTSTGSTPLHLAAIGDHGAIIAQLFQNSADSSIRTTEGRSALDLAAMSGNVAAASALLDGEAASTTNSSTFDTSFFDTGIPVSNEVAQWKSLNHAAINGHTAAARVLYERVGGMKNRGAALLHWAAEENLLKLLQVLIEFGADFNVTDGKGWSLLQKAAKADHEAVVSLLLEKGVDVDHRGPKARTALHEAASKNASNTVNLLLAKGADAAAADDAGATALTVAVEGGSTEAADALLAKATAADLKIATAPDGKSAIQVAILEDKMDTLRLLLKIETARGDGYLTELHTAAANNDVTLAKLLVEHGAALNTHGPVVDAPLSSAVNKGHEAVAKFLLEAGADVNTVGGNKYTPIQAAAFFKNVPMMKLLTEHGANLNATREGGRTALHQAAEKGNLDVVKFLVENGADATLVMDTSGYTPIHFGASSGHDDVITYFLDSGIDVNIRTKLGAVPLHAAARYGQISSAKLLISRGGDKDAVSNAQETPIYDAARSDSGLMIQFLIDEGAKVNSRNNFQQPPAMVAAHSGQETALRILVENGADISMLDSTGHMLFHFAASGGHVNIGKYLLQKNQSMEMKATVSGRTPVLVAAIEGKLDFIKWILEEGADVNAISADGSNLLHLAAYNGRLDVAKLAVEKGISVHSLNGIKDTSLQRAAWGKHVDIAEFLLDKGADPNAAGGTSRPPLLLACEYGPLKMVELLVRRKANMKVRTEKGKFGVLHVAAGSGQVDISKFLITEGADVEDRDEDGSTPLISATVSCHESTIRLLLSKGANLFATSKLGNTPTLQSGRTGTPAIIKFLIEKGGNINDKSTTGWTALHHAAVTAKEDIIDLLVDLDPTMVQASDTLGWTPLHRAVYEKKDASLRKLIARGAVVDQKMNDGRTALSQASRNGYTAGVEILIKAGASMTSECNAKWTPLHYAATENHVETLKMMIGLGGSYCHPMDTGHTPFHIAAQAGHIATLEYLFGLGAPIDHKTTKGHSGLHLAAEYGRAEVITWLIQHGSNDNLTTDSTHATAMHIACEYGFIDVVRRLVEIGASVNEKRDGGFTPLHDAVWSIKNEVAKYMIHEVPKVDINVKTEKGHTPLHLAAEYNALDIGRDLLLKGAALEIVTVGYGYTPLHLAAEKGSELMARLLISNGAQINARTSDKRTPLHIAAQFKQTGIAQILILRNAEINATSDTHFGGTALHLCAEHGSVEVARIINDARPDSSAKDKFQFTPLMRAIVSEQKEMVELLVWRSRLDVKGQLGWSALHWAAYQDRGDLCRVLTGAGASKWAKNDQGMTARDLAVRMSKNNALQYL